MKEEEKYQKLKEIVKTYLPDDVDVESIQLESNFTTELNINSANLVDIVLDVEDVFDIRLENEDMDGMQTVNDALMIINKKIAGE
ncbi:acyl carrier protein [Croceitalea rosinachiae]|uniref:Phosphopantetheine-binding protein n=1 Tax=Croceitalea rosinachiae TaxID=3075596 RepID=A0ABU3ABS4_9FLAO|nr:phosphopantetheine-binding protein [Croceitalea sp. F388]MDT0607629.1 phosphopantetheine-binding protein [Croceitalea sp. F388]